MSYCLDTSIVVALFRGDELLKSKFTELSSRGELFINYITLCELYKGAFLSILFEKSLQEIAHLLNIVEDLEFNTDACILFGKEYARLNKLGKQTEELDLMIASIAKAYDLTIVTRNKKHFENIDVKIEVW